MLERKSAKVASPGVGSRDLRRNGRLVGLRGKESGSGGLVENHGRTRTTTQYVVTLCTQEWSAKTERGRNRWPIGKIPRWIVEK